MVQPPESPYGPPVGFSAEKPAVKKPVWAEVGLLGVGSRRQAMWWFGGTLAASIVAIAVVFFVLYRAFAFSVLVSALGAAVIHLGLALAALWYRLCIQWMDEHDGW